MVPFLLASEKNKSSSNGKAPPPSSLISSFLRVCNAATIELGDEKKTADAVKATIGICMKFINKKELLLSTIPETYVDWGFVDDYVHPSNNPGMNYDSFAMYSLQPITLNPRSIRKHSRGQHDLDEPPEVRFVPRGVGHAGGNRPHARHVQMRSKVIHRSSKHCNNQLMQFDLI